jgi:nucleotide-binding universal stress UspA family protein
MYRSILVPLDGSPASEHALPWALSIAQLDGTTLYLARVHVPPAPIMVGSELASDMVLDKAIRDMEKKYLADLSDRLRKTSTIRVECSLLEGVVADEIQNQATAVQADLIVMSTHGRGAFARFWLGSTADKIVRHSSVPTLLVRPGEQSAPELTDRPFIKKIVIPLDGSELAERAIEPATKLGRTVGAEYSLALVLDAVEDIEKLARMKIPQPGGWFPEATEAKAEAYLDKIAASLRSRALKVETKVIRHGSAATAILDFAQTHGNPVIVLATHGRGGIKRLLLGSVADKMIRGATVPVLVYHPSEAS